MREKPVGYVLKKISWKFWMAIIISLSVPIIRETYFPDFFVDEVWNLYLIPVAILAYYDGLRGALIAVIPSCMIFLAVELKSLFIEKKALLDTGQVFAFMFIIVWISIVIGNLTEKLHEKEKKLEEMNLSLAELTVVDPLTGLYNRRYLEMRLESEIKRAKRKGYPVSFLMIDGDNFKEINDTYGHPEGDRALKQVAEKLRSLVRNEDIVARYGGDEFCVVLPDADKKVAMEVAKRLCQASHDAKLSISIGYASYPADAKNSEELIEAADKALLEAKKQGKSKAVCYIPVGKVTRSKWNPA